MGGVASSPWLGGEVRPLETTEYLIGDFVGEKSFPLVSDYWQKLLELPLDLSWRSDRVLRACQHLAMNNHSTRHLAKILIHLSWCLQECLSASWPSPAFSRALNALCISSVFLKYLIEESKSDKFEELYLCLDETEPLPDYFSKGERVESLVMRSVFKFLGTVDVSSVTYLLHQQLLNFVAITMSTQLISGPSPGPCDIHPFIDSAMILESTVVNSVVRKLLMNYLIRPRFILNNAISQLSFEGNETSLLLKVGFAAASLIRLPLNYLVSSKVEASQSSLAEACLNVLLLLCNYRRSVSEKYVQDQMDSSNFDPIKKEETCFSENPFCRALENIQDTEFDLNDVEVDAHSVPLVRIPFASLFDSLGMFLADETFVLLLYMLLHGNPSFLEYTLVRTDIDTLLMPMLETLYNAPAKAPNHIYMVLVILLILSQDPCFSASIHKVILPNVSWYMERRLNQTSLGSLMVVILIRTVRYNLSKMQDVYLLTSCLATLANMAPHTHRLSSYASQRLVSLFYMLSRKYDKLAEIENAKTITADGDLIGENLQDDTSADLHICTDFLRHVLEILNAILTYTLPRNPEVVYAIMQRQEVFLPFKNHPRFSELLENIYTVLDFFNNRVDADKMDHDWSVEKALQVIIHHSRSWRGGGMKLFSQLHFTYEQEKHPEEFFIPYVWQLILSKGHISFNPASIHLFPVPIDDTTDQQMKRLPSDEDVFDEH